MDELLQTGRHQHAVQGLRLTADCPPSPGARVCVSIVLVVLSLFVTGCGTKKSNCCGDNPKSKNITLALGGSLYLLSFLTTLIPVSWVAHTVIRNFSSPLVVDSQKRQLGEALFIGWATSGMLLITGVILLSSYGRRRSKEEEPYTDVHLIVVSIQKEGSVYLGRTPSSSYKHQEYCVKN